MDDATRLHSHKKTGALIAELEAEHRKIITLFQDCLSHGIRTENGKSKFKEAKHALIAHHEKETTLVYRPLQKYRQEKKAASGIGNHRYDDEITFGFTHTIEMLFEFEKTVDSADFYKIIDSETSLIKLIDAIMHRTNFEENVIYLMFGKAAKI